jgi:thiamine transport system ATP-binding protein
MLVLEGLSARFGERVAVDRVSLSIRDGELLSLLGPSGSGKTTLLRLIAGLELASDGRVVLDGRDLAPARAHERGIGLMFQDFALFQHRNVGANVAFGLRMQGLDAGRIQERVDEVLELVGLPGIEQRSVATLSGGEQQRVALARAIAPRPRLLMLDEPMGSLDRALRDRLPLELRAIFENLGITVLYVTHDQEEAFAVADRTIILRDGRVEADGTPEELWTRPPTAFAARFLGFHNVAEAEVRDGFAVTPWGRVPLSEGAPEGHASVLLRSDALSISSDGPIHGRVSARRFRGDHVLLTVTVGGPTTLEIEARGGLLPAVGDPVAVSVEPGAVVLIPPPADPAASGPHGSTLAP